MTVDVSDAAATIRTPYYELLGPGRVALAEAELGPLPQHWVRVRLAYCGLCGSDVSYYAGRRRKSLPATLGHEWVATVEATGPGVGYFSPGDTVTTDLNFRCGRCRACTGGRSHLCEQSQVGLFTNRGFALRAHIHASYLQKCAGPPAPHLALSEPMSCALHAIQCAGIGVGDRVVVVGAGGIGTCMAFLLAQAGPPGRFDITDVVVDRLDALGRAVHPRGRVVIDPTGPYDVVLDASGSVAGLQAASQLVAGGGRISTVSRLPDEADAGPVLHRMQRKDVTLHLSYLNGEPATFAWCVRLLEQRWDAAWGRLLDIRPLDDLPRVLSSGVGSAATKVIFDVAASALSNPVKLSVDSDARDPANAR